MLNEKFGTDFHKRKEVIASIIPIPCVSSGLAKSLPLSTTGNEEQERRVGEENKLPNFMGYSWMPKMHGNV